MSLDGILTYFMFNYFLSFIRTYLLCLTFYSGDSDQNPSPYELNSLKAGDESSFYPLFDNLPTPRVHHSTTSTLNYIIVYGGYHVDGSFLDDISLYDTHSQSWSGKISRKECCDSTGNVVETLGLNHDINLHKSKVGFQGDIPLARAEHSAVSLNGKLYIFGGNSNYGLLNDFYTFDPINLLWSPVQDFISAGGMPSRRAGHSMVASENNIYIFGGRSTIRSGNTTYMVGKNDIWKYDSQQNSFLKIIVPNGLEEPVGRQFSSATVALDHIWIFGGMDPSSRAIFNDVWAFSTKSHVWRQISRNSGAVVGFAPPSLYLAHLIPVTHPATTLQENIKLSLIVYGGVGSGGSCGPEGVSHSDSDSDSANRKDSTDPICTPLQTALGQVYRIEMSFGHWSSGRLQSATGAADTQFVSHYSWEYVRLTSTDDRVDRGRLRKLFAFESATFSHDNQLFYEFGGMMVSPVQSDPSKSLLNANQTARGLYTPLSLSAGGHLGSPLWDLLTTEHLKRTVGIPTQGQWDYTDGFTSPQPLPNVSHNLLFLDVFRVYKVTLRDIIQFSGLSSSLR
mmetsp:Transcript_331/g.312  ORF Transcript_331/g.312 Transcript_331/m.312 type:complete len:565 (-) Transcript_331:155-1849(-)